MGQRRLLGVQQPPQSSRQHLDRPLLPTLQPPRPPSTRHPAPDPSPAVSSQSQSPYPPPAVLFAAQTTTTTPPHVPYLRPQNLVLLVLLFLRIRIPKTSARRLRLRLRITLILYRLLPKHTKHCLRDVGMKCGIRRYL